MNAFLSLGKNGSTGGLMFSEHLASGTTLSILRVLMSSLRILRARIDCEVRQDIARIRDL